MKSFEKCNILGIILKLKRSAFRIYINYHDWPLCIYENIKNTKKCPFFKLKSFFNLIFFQFKIHILSNVDGRIYIVYSESSMMKPKQNFIRMIFVDFFKIKGLVKFVHTKRDRKKIHTNTHKNPNENSKNNKQTNKIWMNTFKEKKMAN